MSKIFAVIYPIPLRFVNRIFAEKRNVFVKYLAHPTKVGFSSKSKILFYASQGQKEIVGEASIRAIEFLTATEAMEKYSNRLFLNKDELIDYASQESSRAISKKMLVLALSKPKKYSVGIHYKEPITMGGKYLTEEDYSELF